MTILYKAIEFDGFVEKDVVYYCLGIYDDMFVLQEFSHSDIGLYLIHPGNVDMFIMVI